VDEPPKSLSATVARGVGLAGAGYFLTRALTLGSYLVLARLASPEEFGQLAAGGIVVGVGLLFTDSGMLAAVIHRRDRVEEAAATAVVATVASGFGFGLLALALSPVVGDFFDSETIAAVAAAMAGVLFLRSLPIVPAAILQRRFSFLRRLVADPASAVAFGVVAVVATAEGMGVWGLVLGHYASAITEVLSSWGLARWRPNMRLASVGMWRELVGYGRHVFVSAAILRAGDQIPAALIGRFIGTGALGQFRYAARISDTAFAMLLSAGSYVLFPAFARIAPEPDRFRGAFVRALRLMATLAFPAGLLLVPLGEPAAILIFGDVWAEAGRAAMALCLFTAGRAIVSIVSEGLKASGRPRLLVRLHAFEVIAATIAMVALLPFGLVGVAAGVSIGTAAGAGYALRLAAVSFAIGGRTLFAVLWVPLAAAAITATVVFALERLLIDAASHGTGAGLALLAAELLVAALTYLALLRVLAPTVVDELRGMLAKMRTRSQPPSDRVVEDLTPDPLSDPISSP